MTIWHSIKGIIIFVIHCCAGKAKDITIGLQYPQGHQVATHLSTEERKVAHSRKGREGISHQPRDQVVADT